MGHHLPPFFSSGPPSLATAPSQRQIAHYGAQEDVAQAVRSSQRRAILHFALAVWQWHYTRQANGLHESGAVDADGKALIARLSRRAPLWLVPWAEALQQGGAHGAAVERCQQEAARKCIARVFRQWRLQLAARRAVHARDNAERNRRHLLLAFRRWRQHARALRSARQHRKQRVMSAALATWRRGARLCQFQRQTCRLPLQRWRLLFRARLVVQLQAHELLGRTMTQWRTRLQQTASARALAHQRLVVVQRQLLRGWRRALRLRLASKDAVLTRQRQCLHNSLLRWHHKAQARRGQRALRAGYDQRLLASVFDQWRQRARLSRASARLSAFRRRLSLRLALSHWRRATGISAWARRAGDAERLFRLQLAFYRWQRRCRIQDAARRLALHGERRILRQALLHWRDTLNRGSRVQARLQRQALALSLQRWRRVAALSRREKSIVAQKRLGMMLVHFSR